MDKAIVIGSGIAGCACAVRLADAGVHVLLVSPFPSERSQSVMAAGGINAVLGDCEAGDSVASHVDDTMNGGHGIAGEQAVKSLCEHASDVVEYLERIGTVFSLEPADALVMATGGQNALFGKTTGSTQCDGYAAGKLFMQGVDLKNLEFIQYHPTTIETSQKRMLISEAVRGEGGRLFYLKGGERVYFMEEKYGSRGNLMPRDIVSQEIEATGCEVYLDAAFLGKRVIDERLPEVRDICQKYRGIDIAKEPIPVVPSVHFFMGGIAVDNQHETNVENLFAIGECASIYHGANRLGGNSLLAAVYSGWVAARNKAKAGEIKALYDERFGRDCSKALSCMDVCPAGISTIASMARLNR